MKRNTFEFKDFSNGMQHESKFMDLCQSIQLGVRRDDIKYINISNLSESNQKLFFMECVRAACSVQRTVQTMDFHRFLYNFECVISSCGKN